MLTFLVDFQVAALKDTIAKKDEEIGRLQLLKDHKTVYSGVDSEKQRTSLRSLKASASRGLGLTEKAASDHDNCSEYSDKHSESDSQQSMDDLKCQNESLRRSTVAVRDIGRNIPADADILGFGDAEYERFSDVSDGGLSVGTETDGSAEHTIYSEGTKPLNDLEK